MRKDRDGKGFIFVNVRKTMVTSIRKIHEGQIKSQISCPRGYPWLLTKIIDKSILTLRVEKNYQ